MKAEEFFDETYTIHINDFIRMPKGELYELMEAYAKQEREEMIEKLDDIAYDLPECNARRRINFLIEETKPNNDHRTDS